MKASVFIGEVTERVVERPREISAVKLNGLASPAPTWRGNSLGSQSFAGKPNCQTVLCPQRPTAPSFPATGCPADDDMPQIDSAASMKQIMQMSPEELLEAQREVTVMFKPANLAFLQKMATKNSSNGGSTGLSIAKKSLAKKEKSCINVIEPKSEKNLSSIQVASPTDAISLDKVSIIEEGKNNLKKLKRLASKPVLSTRTLMRSSKDRFDLKGSKVIDQESTVVDVAAALQENAVFKSWRLSKSDVESIAAVFVDSILDVGFAVEHNSLDDSQPQDELLNHQMDSDTPGYNMTEICEFYRCENPSQRLLGMNILFGLLQKRDHAVSLEAYNMETPLSLSTADCFDSTRPRRQEVQTSDPSMTDFEKLQITFDKICRHTVEVIVRSTSSSGQCLEERAALQAHCMAKLSQSNEKANIRRVLVYVLLVMCASDLPTGLPTLLVWGITQPRISPTIAVSTLKCLREYLRSGPEEQAAERLWDGFWGSAGCPSLPMAHSRRAETPYEEHIEDCFDNRRNVLDEEQKAIQEEQEGNEATQTQRPPMFETFALQCRWGRVDRLAGEGVVGVLCSYIAAGAAVQSSLGHSARGRERDGASSLALQSASIALEALYCFCRLCDKETITSVTLQVIRIWRPCLALLDSDASNGGGGGDYLCGQKGDLSCGWWKIVAEMCRRSKDFAVWICEEDQNNVISKCLILLLRSSDGVSAQIESANSSSSSSDENPSTRAGDILKSQRQSWDCAVWAMRVWRVCAAYGEGLTSVSELLLAAQLEGRPVKPVSMQASQDLASSRTFFAAVARAMGPGMVPRAGTLGRILGVLWLLEQAAVSCAAVIDIHTVKVAQREKEEGKVVRGALAPNEELKELQEDVRVGLALETARLLLGVAERLLPTILTAASRDSERDSGQDPEPTGYAPLPSDVTLVISASMNFLSSVLGTWQPEPSSRGPAYPGSSPPTPSFLGSAFCELEGLSLRQHRRPTGGPGLGLLQSCVRYAQYVRVSCSKQHLVCEPDSNKDMVSKQTAGTTTTDASDDANTVIDSKVMIVPKSSQFQFAALHHLDSSINRFIISFVTSTTLSELHENVVAHTSCSEDSLLSDTKSGTCIYSRWVCRESALSTLRLLSNAASYTRFKTLLSVDRSEEDRLLLCAIYSAAAERLSVRAHVRPAVAEGLYAWQSSRLLQASALTDLQLVLAGHRVGCAGAEATLSACLACLLCLGQGMKRPAVQIVHVVINLINAQLLEQPYSGKGTLSQVRPLSANLTSNKVPFSIPESSTGKVSGVIIDGDLKNQLLRHILGSKEEVDKAMSYSDFSAILKPANPDSPPSCPCPHNLADWKDACIDSKLPVPRDWALEGLSNMEGQAFERWLLVLSRMECISATSNRAPHSFETSHKPFCSLLMSSHVANLYGLLRLVRPDQAYRWRCLDPDTHPTLVTAEDEECMVVSDFSEVSAASYCSLLSSCSQQIATEHRQKLITKAGSGGNIILEKGERGIIKDREVEIESTICEQFIAASQREVSSSHALSAKRVRALVPLVQGGTGAGVERDRAFFGFGVKAEAGAMDLCGQLLDGLTSQTIGQDIHCASVLCLLSPYLSPWRVRERVWRELGQLRLLHLLEDESIVFSMLGLLDSSELLLPVVRGDKAIGTWNASSSSSRSNTDHVPVTGPHSRTGILVSRAILDSLSSLRSEDDRNWLIVAVGLYHVTHSIFFVIKPEPGRAMFILNSSQVRMLTEMLSDHNVGDWIVLAVLLALDCFFSAYEEDAQAWLHCSSQDCTLEATFRSYQQKRREIIGAPPPLSSFQFINYFATSASSEIPISVLELFALHRPHLS